MRVCERRTVNACLLGKYQKKLVPSQPEAEAEAEAPVLVFDWAVHDEH